MYTVGCEMTWHDRQKIRKYIEQLEQSKDEAWKEWNDLNEYYNQEKQKVIQNEIILDYIPQQTKTDKEVQNERDKI